MNREACETRVIEGCAFSGKSVCVWRIYAAVAGEGESISARRVDRDNQNVARRLDARLFVVTAQEKLAAETED